MRLTLTDPRAKKNCAGGSRTRDPEAKSSYSTQALYYWTKQELNEKCRQVII